MLGSTRGRGAARPRGSRRWPALGRGADLVAAYGCPFGTLAAELDRRDDGLDREAAEADRPHPRLGRGPVPRRWAAATRANSRSTLLAGVQGAALLANTFRDPQA